MLAMMRLSVEAPKFTFTYQIQRLLNILNTNLDMETSTTTVVRPALRQ